MKENEMKKPFMKGKLASFGFLIENHKDITVPYCLSFTTIRKSLPRTQGPPPRGSPGARIKVDARLLIHPPFWHPTGGGEGLLITTTG